MEAARDFISSPDSGSGGPESARAGLRDAAWADADRADGDSLCPHSLAPEAGVGAALALLRQATPTAVQDAAMLGFQAAADLAAVTEELFRLTEYWQLVSASAVDRTRKQAGAGTPPSTEWTTGWRESSTAAQASVAADDGFRTTAEFLRVRLHISLADARSRLRLAEGLLPRQELAGETLPPVHEELGNAVAAGEVSARSAGMAVAALARAKPLCDAALVSRMELALTRTAVDHDPDFLARIAQRWLNAVDQDGTEPSEELLRQLQGAFVRKPRHGLQHLEIFATGEQFEQLLTVMNAATNPRTGPEGGPGGSAAEGDAELDLRSVPQKRLDGLVGGCSIALGSGGLPAAGGLRPQVMVTIDYRDLLESLDRAGRSRPAGTGAMLFTGPVTASTVRKIACDADIIPVVLGGAGRVLDIGRAGRVFPPHIRRALVARDQGCTFPGCSMPAPWCEAHHIDYWSRGGSTGTDNGALLCSHHHHVIHKEQWEIRIRSGVPWFIPPSHLDPGRKPRRNDFFRATAA